MGISLDQYRASIGSFDRCKYVRVGFTLSFSLLTTCIVFLLHVLICLLILSGDIETNPGPGKCRMLRACHVNIRSLSRAKFLAIKTSLADVYDIITISETHLHVGVPNSLFEMQGFHEIIRGDRKEGAGGVAIFIRNTIQFKRLYQYENQNLEAIWLQINSIDGKVLFCCCYRPPDYANFWTEFDTVIDIVKGDVIRNIFILGDLNADFRTVNGRKLQNMTLQQNFEYLVTEPTRITDRTATVLDQILTNAPNFVRKVEVMAPVSTNDHCTVGIHLDFKINNDKAYFRTVWFYKNAKFGEFRDGLLNADFESTFVENDIDASCERWTETFLNVARTHIPNKVITVRPKDSPWYTNELRNLKRKMIRAFHKYKHSRKVTDWEKYKQLASDYHAKLNVAETNYKQSMCNTLSESKNNKKWWSTVKWLLGKGGDCSYPALNVDDEQITDSKDKAEAFNKSFLSYSNIDDSNASLPEIDETVFQGLDEIIATEDEVEDFLKCMDPSKATGPDGVSPRLLKEAGHCIVPSLTKLINQSLSLGTVPSKWKIANVIPLFKKGDKSLTTNYRPVSLLSCVSKILERVVFKHLFNYLRSINFISPHQSGFQPGDSSVNQLSYLYHEFAQALDQKKDVHIVFCDITKAFDRVWHEGLLYKLRNAGICGKLLVWFRNYLFKRYQSVVIRGQKSEMGLIKAGVPQGSVLGPLLFLIYINDITSITGCKIKLFADDTSLYIEFDNPDAASEMMNEHLTAIQNWSHQWLVKFSPAKTKLMTCSFKKKTYPNITFNNVILASVSSHKHLGLTLSKNLTWTDHIKDIIKSVSPMSDVLKKLKYDLDRKTIETTYFSFIRPKLEYGAQVWDNCGKRNSELLESFQLGLARVATGARKGTSHELLYRDTNWNTLSQRRQLIKFKNFVKIANKEAPQYLQSLLPNKLADIRPNTRAPNNYEIIKSRTETFKKSFIPSSITLWNKASDKQRTLDHIASLLSQRKSSELCNYGNRKENIQHSQLRLSCSKLNAHLFALHVVDSPSCNCGYVYEDSNHYLLHCPLYLIERNELIHAIETLVPFVPLNVNTLLFGLENVDIKINLIIFEAVHKYIKETGRL